MLIQGDKLIFGGRSGFGGIIVSAVLMGSILLVIGIGSIVTHVEPELGTSYRSPLMGPLATFFGFLLVATGMTIGWLTLGKKVIDRSKGALMIHTPFLGASKEPFEDFTEIHLMRVSYKGQYKTHYSYSVKLIGRKEGNVILLSTSETLSDAQKIATQVSNYTGLQKNDETL